MSKRKNRCRRTNQHLTKKIKKKQIYIGGNDDDKFVESVKKFEDNPFDFSLDDISALLEKAEKYKPSVKGAENKIWKSTNFESYKDFIGDTTRVTTMIVDLPYLQNYIKDGGITGDKDFIKCINKVFVGRSHSKPGTCTFKGTENTTCDDIRMLNSSWVKMWNKVINDMIKS